MNHLNDDLIGVTDLQVPRGGSMRACGGHAAAAEHRQHLQGRQAHLQRRENWQLNFPTTAKWRMEWMHRKQDLVSQPHAAAAAGPQRPIVTSGTRKHACSRHMLLASITVQLLLHHRASAAMQDFRCTKQIPYRRRTVCSSPTSVTPVNSAASTCTKCRLV